MSNLLTMEKSIPEYQVTNLKFHFRTYQDINFRLFENLPETIFYIKKDNKILKTSYAVFCFLGKYNCRYVNVTGVKNWLCAKKAIIFFQKISKIDKKSYYDFFIDVISLRSQLVPGKKEEFLKNESNHFSVFSGPRFPATFIKKKDGVRATISYFNSSGKIIVNGLKNLQDFEPLIYLLKSEFDL